MLSIQCRSLATRTLRRTLATHSTNTAQIGFGLSADQKELQDLARKFTAQEIIPKVQQMMH